MDWISFIHRFSGRRKIGAGLPQFPQMGSTALSLQQRETSFPCHLCSGILSEADHRGGRKGGGASWRECVAETHEGPCNFITTHHI